MGRRGNFSRRRKGSKKMTFKKRKRVSKKKSKIRRTRRSTIKKGRKRTRRKRMVGGVSVDDMRGILGRARTQHRTDDEVMDMMKEQKAWMEQRSGTGQSDISTMPPAAPDGGLAARQWVQAQPEPGPEPGGEPAAGAKTEPEPEPEPVEQLRAELLGLPLGKLRERASVAGVDMKTFEEKIDEADDPKAAAANLIVSALANFYA